MAELNQYSRVASLSFRGKFGLPGGFGEIVFGLSQYGLEHPCAGVYQRRFREKNPLTHELNKKVSKTCVRMRYYWSKNMYTRPQHSYCSKFRDAMTAWGALTAEQKAPWIKKAIQLHLPSPNLFVKAYMLDRELVP
jgi:hypothetical protein